MIRKPKVHMFEIGDIMESIPDIDRNQESDAEHQNEERKEESKQRSSYDEDEMI